MNPQQLADFQKLQKILPQLEALAKLAPDVQQALEWVKERKEQLVAFPLDPNSAAIIKNATA